MPDHTKNIILAKYWCITEANWPKLTSSVSQCYNNIICNSLTVTEIDQLKLTTTEPHCWITDVCNTDNRLCFAHGQFDEISAFTLYSEYVRHINAWSNLRMSSHSNTDYSRIKILRYSEVVLKFLYGVIIQRYQRVWCNCIDTNSSPLTKLYDTNPYGFTDLPRRK
jgi:hypothetical protein